MKVLFATDGSESARQALDFLQRFPLPADSELTLMSVIDREIYGDSEETDFDSEQLEILRETKQILTEVAETHLGEESSHIEKPGLATSTLVRTGHPAEEIIRAAKELDIDLVVVGSHGLGGVKRFLLGSISDQVLQYAPCSVLIVRPPLQEAEAHPLRLLLAYDDSPHSKRAIEFCAALPLSPETEISVVTVMPLVTLYRQDVKQQLNTLWKAKEKIAEKKLAKIAEEVKWPSTEVSTRLVESEDISHAILEAAEESGCDLIVLGNKGTGAIKKFLLGSITRRIAHHAPCSVLAVRKKKNETD